jgi:hypothetical protein
VHMQLSKVLAWLLATKSLHVNMRLDKLCISPQVGAMDELRTRHGDAPAVFTPAAGAAALLASQLHLSCPWHASQNNVPCVNACK